MSEWYSAAVVLSPEAQAMGDWVIPMAREFVTEKVREEAKSPEANVWLIEREHCHGLEVSALVAKSNMVPW